MSIVPVNSSVLERAGARVTRTSLELDEFEVSYETFEELAKFVTDVEDSSAWWLGDLLLQLEMRHGDKVYQAAIVTGLAEQTITNRMSICERVPRPRRRSDLKFSHHAEVAYQPPEEQIEWLERAAANDWTRSQLRQAIRDANGVASVPESQDPEPEVQVLPPMAGTLVSDSTTRLLQALRKVYDAEGVTLWLAHAIEKNWPMSDCIQRVEAMETGAYL